jgi:prepilin-type N-terminal cleavage/methylation domain-containing protein
MQSKKTLLSKGFTLIELLVVVAILVILAGLVLPRLDRVQAKANKGVSGNGSIGVARYVQTARVLNNAYPDQWDSLLQTSGVLWTGAEGSKQLDPQLTGVTFVPGNHHKIIETAFTAADDEYVRSLSRIGIKTFMDVDPADNDFPGNAFHHPRVLTNTSKYATINAISATDPNPTADGDAKAIIAHLYPKTGAIPTDVKLIVLGFGPTNTAIGDVMQEVPFYANTEPNLYYHRYLCIFEAYGDGKRAQLKATVGADGDIASDELNEYYTE